MKIFSNKDLIDQKAQMEIELYKKRMASLVNEKLDYSLLQELINKTKDDVVIDLTLKDGTHLVIRRDNKNEQSFWDFV